jgi:hypothetical protein
MRKTAAKKRQSLAGERPQVLDGALTTAPQSRARPLRLRLPGRRAALHRLRNNRPPPDPELAGAGSQNRCASNLVAACPRCNYDDGARVAAQNTRRTIEHLRALVEEQQQQIAQMAERLARYEPARNRPVPRIF